MMDPNAVATPLTEQQAIVYLTVALTQALQGVPPENVALYILALSAIESGNWQKLVGNNPGNLIAGGYFPPKTTETLLWSGKFWRPDYVFDGSRNAEVLAGKIPSAFRVYPDPQTGWNDYAKLVTKHRSLLDAAQADDPLAFVRALRSTGYSQDYTDATAQTFRSLVNAYRSKGHFAAFRGVELPGSPVAQSSTPSKATGMGPAIAILGVVALLFVGTLMVKPGSRRRLAAA
jgi:hypothetical protein